jgi:hypothetical protein
MPWEECPRRTDYALQGRETANPVLVAACACGMSEAVKR